LARGERPIGVFDSGVGGLSVLRHVRAMLPGEDLLYVADSAHAPYGDKSVQFIEARAMAIAEFLVARDAKALVVACNTATAAAITALRQRFGLPIVGMEPAVKPAAEATRSGVIGVLATSGTLDSGKFAELVQRFGSQARVIVQPCPGLVEQVELGDLAGPLTRRLLEGFIAPLLDAGADTLVLGCTHFPFLQPLLRELVGEEVAIIETGAAVARQLVRRLAEADFSSGITPASGHEPSLELRFLSARPQGTERFFSSGEPGQLQTLLPRLWGSAAAVASLGR
jgi:glutamate racemase